jgi:hypothetical protein
MSIPVIAYACSFKCGRRVTTKRKSMDEHEARCFHNPIHRACQSCALNVYERGQRATYDDPHSEPAHYYCADDHLERDENFRKDCPHWTTQKP